MGSELGVCELVGQGTAVEVGVAVAGEGCRIACCVMFAACIFSRNYALYAFTKFRINCTLLSSHPIPPSTPSNLRRAADRVPAKSTKR